MLSAVQARRPAGQHVIMSPISEAAVVECHPVPVANSAGGWNHPPSFLCPISRQCLHDPVVLSDGHTYERRHIERWLREHSTSPVTGKALGDNQIFPNHAMRNAIEEYFQQVFQVHRRAIRSTIAEDEDRQQGCFRASSGLLRAVDALMQCSLLVNADLTTEAILRRIMNEARTLVGAEVASVFLLDRQRQELVSNVNSTSGELRMPLTAGIAGHVACTGEPVVVPDAYSDTRFNKAVDAETGFKTRDILCAPLKTKKGEVMGVVQLVNKTRNGVTDEMMADSNEIEEHKPGFTADDRQFLLVFASQAATAICSCKMHVEDYVREGDRSSGLCRAEEQVEETRRPKQRDASNYPKIQRVASNEEKVNRNRFSHSFFKCMDCFSLPSVSQPGEKTQKAVCRSCSSDDDQVELLLKKPAIASILDAAWGSWQLDTLQLAELTGNRPLSTLALYFFDRHGLLQHFGLHRSRFIQYIEAIENGYDVRNPYHNRSHAASVFHSMNALLTLGGLKQQISANGTVDAELATMACLLGAAIHDFEHPGLNNDFLVRTAHPHAIRYNDQHVNEHHSIAAAFELLQAPKYNFLETLSTKEFRVFRGLVVDTVLGTDVAEGNRIMKRFSEVCPDSATETADGNGNNPTTYIPSDLNGVSLLLQVAVKCADFSHIALGWELHKVWVQRLEEEFFLQGDYEKELGHSISFLMDRNKPGASSTQIGFFNFAVIPLFRALLHAVPKAKPMFDQVVANFESWAEHSRLIEEATPRIQKLNESVQVQPRNAQECAPLFRMSTSHLHDVDAMSRRPSFVDNRWYRTPENSPCLPSLLTSPRPSRKTLVVPSPAASVVGNGSAGSVPGQLFPTRERTKTRKYAAVASVSSWFRK